MNKYISVHIVACLTKQAIDELVGQFRSASNEQVKHLHAWADTMAGRLICEWRAEDKETLLEWLEERNVRMRGDSEWIMQVGYETSGNRNG